jgi:hypothetical protein
MVTAIVVAMIVLSLGLVVVGLSVHNSETSAFDRNRVQAIHGAEGGLDLTMSTLKSTASNLPCTLEGDLTTIPVVHYGVQVTYYSDWPPATKMDCVGGVLPLDPDAPPAGALVVGQGTTSLGAPSAVTRQMETAVRLTPLYGGFGQAIFSDTILNLQNKFTLNGYQANDGDVFTNGNFTMGNNTVIAGSVYAQGTVSINQGVVKQDVWGKLGVDLHNIDILGKVISSEQGIDLETAHVYGDAIACTTVTKSGNSSIDGTTTQGLCQGPPPQKIMPEIKFVRCDWDGSCPPPPDEGPYTVVEYSNCALAKAFINSGPVGNHVVRISSACALSWGNNSTINLNGNLAIIADGSISTSNRVNINGVGSKWTMFLMRPWPDAGSPMCSSPSTDITVSNNTSFNNLKVFVYNPCVVNFGNNNAGGVDGQIIGGTVNITNQMVMNYVPIKVPKAHLVGFNAEPSYFREVVPA